MLKEIKKEKDVITNQDLFNEIIKKVKKSDKWPSSIIDYELKDRYETGLYNYEFNPVFTLQPGSNEGYYLSLYIRGYYSLTDKFDFVSLGTIKTLFTDKESIRQMAALYGECLIAYEEIMSDELDKFTRKGYDLFLVDKKEKMHPYLSELSSKEKAVERFKLYHEKKSEQYLKGVVRDNLTRKEFVIEGLHSVDYSEVFKTWIIAYCPDTNSFFVTNKRFFFWSYNSEFESEDEAINFFKNHLDEFIEVRNNILKNTGGWNINSDIYLENTEESFSVK